MSKLQPATASESAAPKTTVTNWKALEQAKLVPVEIVCQVYQVPGVEYFDGSCHTRLKADVETLKRHIDAEHGAKFQVYVRQGDSKASPLWAELEAAGYEAMDFRCEVCDKVLRFTPQAIAPHLKPHPGKVPKSSYKEMRGRQPHAIGEFNLTLSTSLTPESASDVDE